MVISSKEDYSLAFSSSENSFSFHFRAREQILYSLKLLNFGNYNSTVIAHILYIAVKSLTDTPSD